MKIIDVQAYHLAYTVDRRFTNSMDWISKRTVTLVKITTDEGLTGWGEAYGPAYGISRIVETYLKDKLVGTDPLRVEYHWQRFQTKKGIPMGAIGGVDIALWDLKAKALGVPLYEILGGKFGDTFLPYASGYGYKEDSPESMDQLDRDIEKATAQGFKALKMKIGFGIEMDMKRVARVREKLGPSISLMVDANQGYNIRTCLELMPFLEECAVKWLEEPLPWHSFAGYQELRKKIRMPIAGGESETTLQGYTEAIRNSVVDIIQPDLPLCGGITPAKKIAALANDFQVDFQPHIFGTILGMPASLHLLDSIPNYQSWCVFPRPMFLEWDTNPNEMARKVLKNPIEITNGVVRVPEGVGLGVEVDEEAMEEFLVK